MNNRRAKNRAIGVGSLAIVAALGVVAFEAQAMGFDGHATGYSTKAVFCDMPEIKGSFSATESRYVSRGTCVELEAKQSDPARLPKGSSRFDDYSGKTKQLFRADWTAEGGYNPATKETWETVTVRALRPEPGRPYGRFTSKMLCSVDPWLDGIETCTGITFTATGNLGDAEKMLRRGTRPFTSNPEGLLRQTLYDAHERFVQRRAPSTGTGPPLN